MQRRDDISYLDVWVVTDEVDAVVGSVDDIENTLRYAGLMRELHKTHSSGRHALRRLQHVSVACSCVDA
jgi:hypothetical protein